MAKRTPSGGDRSEIIYLAEDGRVVTDPAAATSVEIREYAQGVEIRRTYLDREDPSVLPQWEEPGEAVGEPDAVDGTKATWDVYVNDDGIFRLVTSLPDLLAALDWDILSPQDQAERIRNFIRLPSFQVAPSDLKADVAHWLATH